MYRNFTYTPLALSSTLRQLAPELLSAADYKSVLAWRPGQQPKLRAGTQSGTQKGSKSVSKQESNHEQRF